MLAFANSLLAHAARLLDAAHDEPALWVISVHGRVVGTLVCEAGRWRLSWFDGEVSRRLLIDTGTLDGDIEGLALMLSGRLGVPVQVDQLPV